MNYFKLFNVFQALIKFFNVFQALIEFIGKPVKNEQGNHSQRKLGTPYMGVRHFLEQTVFVISKLFKRPFEFELTRSMHSKTMGTCSMAFKKAPDGQLLEAWRILRLAVGDRGLAASSIEVEKWHNDIRLKYSEQIRMKSVWKAVPTGAGSATPASACRRRRFTLVSAADVEETLALKKKEKSSACGRRRFE